jgi:hypothetical protein
MIAVRNRASAFLQKLLAQRGNFYIPVLAPRPRNKCPIWRRGDVGGRKVFRQ